MRRLLPDRAASTPARAAARASDRALVLLADPLPPPPSRAALRALLDRGALDFARLLARARDNGVHGTVGHRLLRLSSDGAPVPPAVAAEARALRDAAVFRELAQRRLLGRILAALAGAGLPAPVLLKGAALRETLYPAPWQRAMDDVDLLVPPETLAETLAALRPLGFSARPADPRRVHTEAGWHARTLTAAGAPLRVDVHTALARPGRFRVEPPAALLWRARPLVVEGQPALALPDGDALLNLALHTAETTGRGALKRLVDLALLVRRGRIVWSWTARRAHRWGATGALRAALWLCARVTGAAPPPWVWERLHAGSARDRLLRALLSPLPGAVFSHEPAGRLRSLALLYWLPDGTAQRLRFAAGYLALRARDALAAGASGPTARQETLPAGDPAEGEPAEGGFE
jgi:hypothetical protein